LATMQEIRKKNSEDMEKLTNLLQTEEGKLLAQEMHETRARYAKANDRFMSLIKAGSKAEATAVFFTDIQEAQKPYFDSVAKMLAYQAQLMEHNTQAVNATYMLGRRLLLSLGIAAFVLTVVLACWITRSVLRRLGGEPYYAAQIA